MYWNDIIRHPDKSTALLIVVDECNGCDIHDIETPSSTIYFPKFGKHSAIVLECLFAECSSRLLLMAWVGLQSRRGWLDDLRRRTCSNQLSRTIHQWWNTGKGAQKLTKDCLQVEQTIDLAASLTLAWLLEPFAFVDFSALRSRFCAALAPCP